MVQAISVPAGTLGTAPISSSSYEEGTLSFADSQPGEQSPFANHQARATTLKEKKQNQWHFTLASLKLYRLFELSQQKKITKRKVPKALRVWTWQTSRRHSKKNQSKAWIN
jgi:hypothetical protein